MPIVIIEKAIIQVKSVIDNFIILISSRLILALFFFFLICPAEIGVCLIHLCVLFAVKYGSNFY